MFTYIRKVVVIDNVIAFFNRFYTQINTMLYINAKSLLLRAKSSKMSFFLRICTSHGGLILPMLEKLVAPCDTTRRKYYFRLTENNWNRNYASINITHTSLCHPININHTWLILTSIESFKSGSFHNALVMIHNWRQNLCC